MGRRLFPNVFDGWVVVTSAALIMLAMSAAFFYGFGTIFKEVIDEFGWSVAATSLLPAPIPPVSPITRKLLRFSARFAQATVACAMRDSTMASRAYQGLISLLESD